MTFVAVLPSIFPPYTDACVASMAPRFRESLTVIDNTRYNRGVATSWNIGRAECLREGHDWLVLVGASMRFGAQAGLDFLAALDAYPDALAVEAHPSFGWHCIAISRDALERVGAFDVNFFPAYWEENDWSHRFRCTYARDPAEPYWPKVEIDATDMGWAHGTELAGVKVDPDALLDYYCAKWGARSPDEKWCSPFNDPSLPLDFQPPGLDYRGPGG